MTLWDALLKFSLKRSKYYREEQNSNSAQMWFTEDNSIGHLGDCAIYLRKQILHYAVSPNQQTKYLPFPHLFNNE